MLENTNMKSLCNITSIVTHPGQAHMDDFLSVAIVAALRQSNAEGFVPVYRREPRAAELEDSRVLVLDVGGAHDPSLNNYDHHQFPREAPPACALTLLCRSIGLDDDMSVAFPWYRATEVIDSKGPFAMAKELGIEGGLPPELNNPVSMAILNMFGSRNTVAGEDILASMLVHIGLFVLERKDELIEGLNKLIRTSSVVSVNGVNVLLAPAALHPPVKMYMARTEKEIGIVVSKDDRGEGLTLFRVDDHPKVDFSRIEEEEEILFAHKGGFIAKTREDISASPRLAFLIDQAIK